MRNLQMMGLSSGTDKPWKLGLMLYLIGSMRVRILRVRVEMVRQRGMRRLIHMPRGGWAKGLKRGMIRGVLLQMRVLLKLRCVRGLRQVGDGMRSG